MYEPTVFVQSCAQFPFIMEHSLKSQGFYKNVGKYIGFEIL